MARISESPPPGFWAHYCEPEKSVLHVGQGEACSWCGREAPKSRFEQECERDTAASIAHGNRIGAIINDIFGPAPKGPRDV